jgi:osmotically-inducible protein OsmY
MTRKNLTSWLGAAVIAIAATACSDRAENKAEEAARDANTAAEKAGDAAREAGRDARDATREAGREAREESREASRDAGNAAERAGEAAATAGREAIAAGDAAVQTADVKMALTTDKRVDASHIDVDTNATTKTVTLKGSVPTAAQKDLAEDIAEAKAPGYRVRNDLTIAR